MRKISPVFVVSAVLLVALLAIAAACPESRPTKVVRVCLVSSELAGEYCPPETVEARRFYTSPRPGEPVAPAVPCSVHKKPEDPPDPDPFVSVEVCADSGLAPGPYCSDHKTIQVRTSALPLAACGIHTTPRLRVYASPYDIIGAVGDWKKYLRDIRKAGAFGIRVFVVYAWLEPAPIAAYKTVGTWTDEETGNQYALFRLSEWNPVFWDKLSEILAYCRELGLEAWLVAEDYCSLKNGRPYKFYNPYYTSEEALSPETPGGVWGEPMNPYHAALFKKVADVAKASGAAWKFEIMNEADALEWPEDFFVRWYKWAIDAAIDAGVPREKMIASVSHAAAELAALVGYLSPHGIGRPSQVGSISGIPNAKLILSSDGFGLGTGPADESGGHGVGLDVADELALATIGLGAYAFEVLDRGIWRNTPAGGSDNRADLSLSSTAVLERMTRGR